MLTPQEISEKEFVKAVFGGYDMAVVDDFLETLSADYASLYKENAILKSKLKVLVEKVEEYRSTEDAMRMALLTAQKMGNDIVKESKAKSEEMLSSAKAEADKSLGDLKVRISEEEARLKVARDATAAFVRESRALTAKLDKFLEIVPTLEMKPKTEQQEVQPQQVREAEIMDTVHDIDNAMAKITEEEAPAADTSAPVAPANAESAPVSAPAADGASENAPVYDDESEYTSPRPKFDFENLRFGSNFSDED
jgi:cell division initiation protein